MTYYEQEIRRIFANVPFFKNAVFNDRTVLADLDRERCVKLTLETGGISNCYDTIRLRVINKNSGEIDNVKFEFWDIFEKIRTKNNPQGITAHIWAYDGQIKWYGKEPTDAERKRLADMVSDYVSIYQPQPTADLSVDIDTEELTDEEEI